MIVGERFLRNKIPETLKSDYLGAQRGGSRVVFPAGSRPRGWDGYAATFRQYQKQLTNRRRVPIGVGLVKPVAAYA